MRPPITPFIARMAVLRVAAITFSALALLHIAPVLAAAPLADALWTPISEASILARGSKSVAVQKYVTNKLDQNALMGVLANAPMEFTTEAKVSPPTLTLPMPDGSLARFSFEESTIMESALAAKFPEIKTYRGQGIDDPAATARFDWLPTGFHAMVLSAAGTVLIDPYAKGNRSNYISYWKHDAIKSANPFTCGVHDHDDHESPLKSLAVPLSTNTTSGTTLRTYRLALAATNEYAATVGGNTIAGTMAAQVLIINRVNAIYEREVAIRLVIVANNNLLIYAGDNISCGGACTAANDPYTNNSVSMMLDENQATIDTVIGTANYDIGHVFGTEGGGLASRGVCDSLFKAAGGTGLTDPTGDTFAVDFVAHEIGHQFSAGHTFNATASGICTADTRAQDTAYEAGAGTTIMSYTGYCGAQDIVAHPGDRFHIKSMEQIIGFSQNGDANTCAVQIATGNTPPTVTGPGNFTIPKGTPFALIAVATDANSDAITYDWQEYDRDAGGVGTFAAPNTDADGTARALFRNYPPTANGTRTFPALQYILNNANVPPTRIAGPCSSGDCLTGELLPAISRAMTFQVVVRDNRASGGGVNTATSIVTIDGTSGPFVITAPNTAVSAAGGSAMTVTWNVAGSAAAPVGTTNVKISLSTDGGNTFPKVLIASTPNNGSKTVTLPNIATTTARIKVEAVGNIFFDVSDADFTITASTILDVDGSGALTRYDAATDGVLVVRYMFGMTGTALTDNARGATATRNSADIKTYLDGLGTTLDIDGDGKIDAVTDGLLIIRYLLGITSGSALTSGAANPVGSRTIAGTIPQYLSTLAP